MYRPSCRPDETCAGRVRRFRASPGESVYDHARRDGQTPDPYFTLTDVVVASVVIR